MSACFGNKLSGTGIGLANATAAYMSRPSLLGRATYFQENVRKVGPVMDHLVGQSLWTLDGLSGRRDSGTHRTAACVIVMGD